VCLAVPAKVIEVSGTKARVDLGGATHQADLTLLGKVEIGDYLLLHAGFAIARLDAKEAEETLKIFREMEGEISKRL
jgi:hydrogenase expression/formation protein HypC